MSYDQIITLDDGQKGAGQSLPSEQGTFRPLLATPVYGWDDASCYLSAYPPQNAGDLTWTNDNPLVSGFSPNAYPSAFAKEAQPYAADFRTADYLVVRFFRPEDRRSGSVTAWIKRATFESIGVYVDRWAVQTKYVRTAETDMEVLRPAGDGVYSLNRVTIAVANEASWQQAAHWLPPSSRGVGLDGIATDPDEPPLVIADALPPLPVFAEFEQPDELLGTRDIHPGTLNADSIIRIRYDDRAMNYSSIRVFNRRFPIASISDVGGRKRQLELRVDIPDRSA